MTDDDERPDGTYSIVKRKQRTPEPEPVESPGFAPIDLPGEPVLEPRGDAPPLDLGLGPDPASAAGSPPALDLDLAPPDAALDLDLAPAEPAPGELAGPPLDLDLAGADGEGLTLEPAAPDIARPAPLSSAPGAAGPGIDVAAVDSAPSTFERAAAHPDRAAPFRRILPPPPQSWWRRKLWHMIGAAILLFCGSYIYGCTKVMGDSVGFRRDMPEVENQLHAMEQSGPLDPTRVKQAVQMIADEHDMTVSRVEVFAEEIGNVRQGPSGPCAPRNWPMDAIMRLHPIDQANLAKAGQYCGYPEYILSIRAHVSERWGLFERAFEESAYVTVNSYAP